MTVADDQSQAEYVVARILETRESGVPLRRQAVLFRSSHHSDTLELELTRRNIPYVKYGGLKFLEAAHVKDLLVGPALGRQPQEPHRRVSRAAAAAGHGAVDGRAVRRAIRALGLFVDDAFRDFDRCPPTPAREGAGTHLPS